MLWLHSLKVAQLLRSAACLHTNQSRSYLNHLVCKQRILLYRQNDSESVATPVYASYTVPQYTIQKISQLFKRLIFITGVQCLQRGAHRFLI